MRTADSSWLVSGASTLALTCGRAPLRTRPQHIEPVLDHDRGAPVSQKGKNSPINPKLPPRLPPPSAAPTTN